jgi:hypothetical protein
MKLSIAAAAAALVFGFGQSASSGVVTGGTPSFSVDISRNGGAPLSLTPTLTHGTGGTYTTSGSQSVMNDFSIVFDYTLNVDPSLIGSFTLTNLSSSTQTFSVAATLSGLNPIAAPTKIHGSHGTVTYSDDTTKDGSVGFGTAGLDPFYRALIDGNSVNHDLGSFAFFLLSGAPGVKGTFSPESFGDPTPDSGPKLMNSIGVSFPGFELTAGDSVQVGFEFVVVPESSFVPTFAIASMLFLYAFAQKRASGSARGSGRILPTGGGRI